MDLDELERGRAALTVPYKNSALHLEYLPERVGVNLQRARLAWEQPPHDVEPMLAQLASIVVSWDLTRGGEPVSISLDSIGALPVALSGAITNAIMEDFHDPKSPVLTAIPSASSTPSPATSTPEDGLASVPTSPSPSSTPDGLASHPGTSLGSLAPVGA